MARLVRQAEIPSRAAVTTLAWIAGTLACLTLAGVTELLRRELRALRTELRDWRHELPQSRTREVRE